MALDINVSTKEEFLAELNKHAGKQVLVDFWASWCGPCRMIAPVLQKIEEENEDVILLKIDVDANSELANAYKVQSIPTLMFFKDGTPNASPIIGVANEETIINKYSK